jgi:hypothetical protein
MRQSNDFFHTRDLSTPLNTFITLIASFYLFSSSPSFRSFGAVKRWKTSFGGKIPFPFFGHLRASNFRVTTS